ncbi:hypothetical protein F4803DRAFT_542279 [Xylaria telfairii]|nr:hypothetical protein F4803DRAFT_542279 [Xylaria telfairii]
MYWTHKWHDDIAKCIEKQQSLHDLDYEEEPRKQDGDPDWRDRIELLLNKHEQNYNQDVEPTTEENSLDPIEIESYQQLISRSRAFEWLVSAIQNCTVLGTAGDNTMNTVRHDILTKLDLVDQNRGYAKARISRHRNPVNYCVRYTLPWPTGKMFQEGDSFKTLSGVFERVLTFTGDATNVQALPCEEYINQTWPTTGPLLIQSILKSLNRDTKTKGKHDLPQTQDDLLRIQISAGLMQVYCYGNAFELAEIGTQLAWLASALYPKPNSKQGIMCKPRVCFGQSSLDRKSKHGKEIEELSCQFEFEITTLGSDEESGRNGNCWQTIINDFVVVQGFPVRSRFGRRPGLEIPLDIAADFTGT